MRPTGLLIIVAIGLVVAFGISGILSSLDTMSTGTRTKRTRLHRDPGHWSIMNNKNKNMFWIVQISDIHMSVFKDPARGPDLVKLCENLLNAIDPEVVLVTGDLTDAKVNNGMDSMQIRDEWVLYQNVMKQCTSRLAARWVDLRGNHDCFDVYNRSSKNNYYRKFSASGPASEKDDNFEDGFIHSIEMPFGSYSFVGIDTCSQPGPNRPFNFFGYLAEKQLKHLRYISSVTSTSNHTIWFGHFPTSLIVQDNPQLREIMSGSIMYLCGHLHTLGNMVPRMYARHKTGQLELELGDWRDNRIFRVIAFDHDIVSFADAQLGQKAIIVVTNPKNSQYLSPETEPVEMIAASTHIRILVFSTMSVRQVTVHIDHNFIGYAVQVDTKAPLYVLKWDPSRYSGKSHKMVVSVVSKDRSTTISTHHFSVDGKQTEFNLMPRILLMLNIYTLAKVTFGLLVFFYVLVLTSLRQCSNIRAWFLQGRNFPLNLVNILLMKIWLASRITSIHYLLVGSVLYMTFGPWFVAYLLRDKIGVVFVWGIIIDGSFLPGGLTYFYGIFQFLVFTVPLSLVLGHLLDIKRRHGHHISLKRHVMFTILTLLLGLFTVYLACGEFVKAYFRLALWLGPVRTGNMFLLPLGIWLALKADLKEVMAGTGQF